MTDDLNVKITAYIAGNLSSEEIDKFEEAMANSPELQEEVAMERQLYLHINEEFSNDVSPKNEYTEKLRKAIRSDEVKDLNEQLLKSKEQYRNKHKKKKSRSLFVYLAAAVVAVLLIAGNGFFLRNGQTSGDLYNQYYSIQDLPSFRKRDANQSIIQEAITRFDNEEYQKAIGLFNTHINEYEGFSLTIYAYIGVSYTALGDEQKAMAAFDKLINSNSIDRSKGLWFKALSYLKLENPDKAKEVLRSLRDTQGFNYKEANLLLKELE